MAKSRENILAPNQVIDELLMLGQEAPAYIPAQALFFLARHTEITPQATWDHFSLDKSNLDQLHTLLHSNSKFHSLDKNTVPKNHIESVANSMFSLAQEIATILPAIESTILKQFGEYLKVHYYEALRPAAHQAEKHGVTSKKSVKDMIIDADIHIITVIIKQELAQLTVDNQDLVLEKIKAVHQNWFWETYQRTVARHTGYNPLGEFLKSSLR